jgi:energy-coupling factor transporter ATP-binding protein EcfA2
VFNDCKAASSVLPDSLSSHQLLLIFLLLTVVGLSLKNQVDAEEVTDGKFQRILFLLGKKNRTPSEKIELFNALLKEGEEEVQKAIGKNVIVIFGNTGAGKSVLMNFLYGCKMMKKDGKMIVDPKSSIKGITAIGTSVHSCTMAPKQAPDINVSILKDDIPNPDDVTPQLKNYILTLYDMAGLTDNRGVDVALANTIVMKKLAEVAKSVRFVLVFEHGQLNPERGEKWKESNKLLVERFNGILGQDKQSLCVIVTKKLDGLDEIKNDILSYYTEKTTTMNLSECTTLYDPLNPEDRNRLLNIIVGKKAYDKTLNTKITLGADQLWEASELGREIQVDVKKDLDRGSKEAIDEAVKKIKFTHGIAKLGNDKLTAPHEFASKSVQEFASKIVQEVDPQDKKPPLKNQMLEFDKYLEVKRHFSPYVDFEKTDKELRVAIKKTDDPRTSWGKHAIAGVGSGGGAAIVAATVTAPPLVIGGIVVGAIGGIAYGGVSAWRWAFPSEEDKKQRAFFDF